MPATAFTVDPSTWPDAQSDRRPPGHFVPSSPYLGGAMFTDPFNAKRAPSPWQLIEKYRNLVYAMVAKNANAVCRIPLRLYADGSRAQGGKPRAACDPIRVLRSVGQRLARDGKISPSAVDQVYEIRTHPLLDLLDNPDPYGYYSRTKLISLLVRYCDVVGSAYLFPDWDGWRYDQQQPKRVPDYLWVLYSQYVLPIRLTASPLIDIFQYFSQRIDYRNVMWFRQNVSLRDPYGSSYSPTYAGTSYSDQEEKFISIYDQVLGLGPRPNMLATAKDPLQPPGEAERKRLEQDMNRRQAGGYAGGLLVNNGAWDFTPMNYAPADMGGKEISEYDKYCLAAIFGQPATYYTVDSNLANLQAADMQHARDGIDPRCKMVAEEFTSLVKRFDNRLFFAFDPSLPEDEELKTRVIDMKVRNGTLTPDQANEESQWPPLPNGLGSLPWIEGTRKTMQMIADEHEQNLAQQDAVIKQTENMTDNADMPASEQFKAKQKESNGKPQNGKRALTTQMIDRALERLERELVGN